MKNKKKMQTKPEKLKRFDVVLNSKKNVKNERKHNINIEKDTLMINLVLLFDRRNTLKMEVEK